MLAPLRSEVLHQVLHFCGANRLAQRNEKIWGAEIAVIFRDFVLQDHVIAIRVPRQLAQEPVILVQVVAEMRENQIRFKGTFQLLKIVLNLAADIGQKAVTKGLNHDGFLWSVAQERCRTRFRFAGTFGIRAEDDPINVNVL